MTNHQVLRALSRFPLLQRGAKSVSRTVLTCIVGALISVTSFPVDAALLDGETVETTNFHGSQPDVTTIIGPETRVVGPGTELSNFGFSGFVNVDFSDTNILITATMDQPFGFFEILRFLDVNGTIPALTGVAINPATNWAGFSASAIFFNTDRIDLTLTGLGALQGQQISLDITGNGNGNGGIPEPASHVLAAIALLSMLMVTSRRQKKAA